MRVKRMRFEGDKPDLNDYIKVTSKGLACKWQSPEDMSQVIGVRLPDSKRHALKNDEILVGLTNTVIEG